MARPLRFDLPGLTHHVTARGNGRMAIYTDDGDRCAFLERLATVVERFRLACHAYCLMTNHYHLVVRTEESNLSAAVQYLNGTYAQWWNRRHAHVGHVFQGRFGAQVIQDDRYLLTACRYVVLNPVRAGMVGSPDEWRWSSYRVSAGLSTSPSFLQPEAIWSYLHEDTPEATARYRRFVAAQNAEPLPSGLIVGDGGFVGRFKPLCERAAREVPRHMREFRQPLEEFFAGAHTRTARAARVVDAYAAGHRPGRIAAFLGVHPTTISRLLRRSLGSDLEKSHLPPRKI